jgi:hypothetical protein
MIGIGTLGSAIFANGGYEHGDVKVRFLGETSTHRAIELCSNGARRLCDEILNVDTERWLTYQGQRVVVVVAKAAPIDRAIVLRTKSNGNAIDMAFGAKGKSADGSSVEAWLQMTSGH